MCGCVRVTHNVAGHGYAGSPRHGDPARRERAARGGGVGGSIRLVRPQHPLLLGMLVWLPWAVSQIVFFEMLTGIALKKKKGRQRDLPTVSDWQLVGQGAAQICGRPARPAHQAPTLGQLWVCAGGRGVRL